MKRSLLVLALVALASAITASATNVNFVGYSPTYTVLPTVSVDGFNFNQEGCCFMYVWPGAPNDPGTPLIFAAFGNGGYVEVDNGGTPFTLNNLDMTISWYDTNSSDTVNLVGNIFGGGTDTTTLILGQGLQVYNLDWSNLASFTISDVASGSGYWALDNINVNGVTPEPGTWLLLGTGLLGLVLLALGRKSSARGLMTGNLA
jgi:hypothetical protein